MANMSRATRMLMLRNTGRENYSPRSEHERRGWDVENRYNGPRYAYDEGRMNYEPESRFRDRRGREHYDNGRFAPMRSRYDGGSMRDWDMEPRNDGIAVWDRSRGMRNNWDEEPEGGYHPYPPPVYEEESRPTINRIGFAMPAEMTGGYRTDASYHRMNEMEHRTSPKMAGRSGGASHFTPEMAEEWMAGIKNQDGSKGPHWKMEDVKKLLAQRKLHKDPYEFWAILNAIYSDYGHIAKKHGVNTMDFYVDMACAWLDDEDANPNKAAIYYEEIVK